MKLLVKNANLDENINVQSTALLRPHFCHLFHIKIYRKNNFMNLFNLIILRVLEFLQEASKFLKESLRCGDSLLLS